jgi:hypothetical protein
MAELNALFPDKSDAVKRDILCLCGGDTNLSALRLIDWPDYAGKSRTHTKIIMIIFYLPFDIADNTSQHTKVSSIIPCCSKPIYNLSFNNIS